MVSGAFVELSGILALAIVISAVLTIFRQPLIIGYILTGLIAGPDFLGIVSSNDNIVIFAHIGATLLLFMVGLNLNPKIVRELGRVSLITGAGQFTFTLIVGFVTAKLLGFDTTTSAYLALGLTFSSTIIIMKLLSDKGDLESVYGRVSIGFMIVQDLIAILILMLISSFTSGEDITMLALEALLKGVGLVALLFLASIYLLPRITRVAAKSQEFLLLFSISWCMALAALFDTLNFSVEIGALLAGVTLSMSPYHLEISSRMRILRDFFLVLFFIYLGSEMVVSHVIEYIVPILVFSAVIIIGNPLIVMALMGALGYTKKNSFFAGLTVAQISEFSLILLAMGVSVGHIPKDILSIMTSVGLLTIFTCSYLILYANRIYPHLSPYLGVFERRGSKVDEHRHHRHAQYDIVLFGCNRLAYDLIESLNRLKTRFLIVDYNPDLVMKLVREGFDCLYGDVSDPELLKETNLPKIKMAISTIKDLDTNLILIAQIKKANPGAIIISTSYKAEDAIRLYDEGANYVIIPHYLGGHKTATMLEEYGFDIEKFLKYKIEHIEYLRKRKAGYGSHLRNDIE